MNIQSSRRRRRRFVVTSSSEEDDEEEVGYVSTAAAAAPPPSEAIAATVEGPSPFPNPNSPLVISDDDDDNEGDHNRHAAPLRSSSSSFSSCSSSFLNSRSNNPHREAVEERLCLLGLRLKIDWLDSCFDNNDSGGGTGDDVEEKARLCFNRFLFEDMNACGAGVLPPDLHSMHNIELEGPFVLQVDEIVNISLPLRERYRQAHPGLKRCLKMLLSDGVQHVFALEYRPIKELDAVSPAGLKVVIRNVVVRHGLLMLVPEVFKVLGGVTEDLELAHQRLVLEISKPFRGKRKQEAGSLSEKASRAAWPSSNAINNSNQANVSTSDGICPPQGNPLNSSSNPGYSGNTVADIDFGNGHGQEANREELTPELSRPLHESAIPCINDTPGDLSATRNRDISASARNHMSESAVLLAASSKNSSLMSNRNFRSSIINFPVTSSERVEIEEHISSGSGTTPELTGPVSGPYSPSRVTHDVGALNMGEEPDQPTLLTDAMEVPFTYMTALQAKWNAKKGSTSFIQGKLKCFLTGVKGFQFRDRDTFELLVYVDDGSQIFEVTVDHLFVQRVIGHPPSVVSAALSSSDGKEIAEMKETMRNFQRFLSNFEGMMIVELNKTDSLPFARELTQGCLVSDAHLLMSRLLTLTAPRSAARCISKSPFSLSH